MIMREDNSLKYQFPDSENPAEIQLSVHFNPGKKYPVDKTIHELFAEQVEQNPDGAAVVGAGNCALTYKELSKRSHRLSRRLREKGVKPGVIVGILVVRSVEMIVGILAILKAGGAYLPLDPRSPHARKRYMLKDSGARLLLTHKGFAKDIEGPCEVIDLEDERLYKSGGEKCKHDAGAIETISRDLAYVIYTSGSTGNPKGVPITHANLCPLLYWGYEHLPLTPADRSLQNLSYYFDWSAWEIFIALTSGSSLYMTSEDVLLDPETCTAYMSRNDITVLHITPTQFQLLISSGQKLETLKYLAIGAEKLTYDLVKRSIAAVNEDCRVYNMYGPTEATIMSAVLDIDREEVDKYRELSSVPIGKPIANSGLLALDSQLNLCPVNVYGELYIYGDGLAAGYLNDPLKSMGVFVGDIFEEIAGGSLYRTGDRVRWLPDGTIEFLERIDHQIKIRGMRVELGEIENRLLTCEKVKDAAVIAREDNKGERYLCAYIVPAREELDVPGLREELSGQLPDYMVPSHFVQLEKMPLNPNGKIDRRALPEPVTASGEAFEFESVPAPPETEIEKKLAEIWSEVLNIHKDMIGIDTNFSHLGGHSLKAVNLVSNIHKKLNLKMKLAEVFELETIRRMAKFAAEVKKDKYAAVPEAPRKDYYPLSPAQKRMFILQRMTSNSSVYNVPYVIPLEGDVDAGNVQNVFRELIKRHESLRTTFHFVDGEPVQRIHDALEVEIEVEAGNNDGLYDFIRPFDLSKAPLLRVGLVKQDEKKYILALDMHHIITDGISMEILTGEFTAIIEGNVLPALRIQYKDYVEWQNSRDQKELIKTQEEYWLKEFAGELPVLDLPGDYARPVVQSFAGQSIYFELGETAAAEVNRLAEEINATLYMVLLAAFSILLSRLCGQEDIIVGTPTSGRRHADLEHIVGMFVSTLAIRSQPAGKKTCKEYLTALKDNTLLAFENQDYPFEDLVENLSIERDSSRNPLFDVMFVLQNMEKVSGKTIERVERNRLSQSNLFDDDNNKAKFDLTLIAVEADDRLLFDWQYCTKLFKKETGEKFIRYFKRIIDDVVENSEKKIADIEILSEEEKYLLLHDFNDVNAKYPLDKTLRELFEEQVEKGPDAIAAVSVGSTLSGNPGQANQHTTYRQLNRQSNLLAHLLRLKGLKPGTTIVALLVERSTEMMVGILGILKAGGAYLPLDPGAPASRKQYMINDSGVKLLLTHRNLGKELEKRCEVIDLEDKELYEYGNGDFNGVAHDGNDSAYVIYTSGSTGNPKGVPITHGNLCPLLYWGYRYLPLTSRDRTLQNLSNYFDWSVWEIFITITSGASLYMTRREVLLAPELCTDFIYTNDITVLHITPTQFQSLIASGRRLTPLKYLCIGAEKLTVELVRLSIEAVNADCRIYNMYGPTEATIMTAVLDIDRLQVARYNDLSSVPIGVPIANGCMLVLDNHLKLCPIGVKGELYISGDGLADGYLNDPVKSSVSFTGNIFKEIRGERLYRTGDIVRWLADGTVEFLGRRDHQVKIRGYRIETGEIENQLLKFGWIKDAVVVIREDEKGEKYLCAYIVPSILEKNRGKMGDVSESALRDYLSGKLPDYMIPSYFVQLQRMPLNPNGKIDIRALPVPGKPGKKRFLPPVTDTEKELADIWSKVLVIDKGVIGIDANFFQLGGHSLKAIQVLSRIEKEFHVEMGQMDLFQHPTLRRLAKAVEHGIKITTEIIEPRAEREYYELSHAQRSLWLHSLLEEEGILYNIPEAYTIEGDLDREVFEQALHMLIKRHEVLRTRFVVEGELPGQKIAKTVDLSTYLHYLDPGEELRPGKAVEEMIINEMMTPFDLYRGPLLRAVLVRLGEKKYVFFFIVHHLIFDGLSIPVFMSELLTLYTGFFKGTDSSLKDLRLQYRDYAIWQNRWLSGERLTAYRDYWREQLNSKGKIPVLDLPMSKPRPVTRSFNGQIMEFEVDSEIVKAVYPLSRRENVTPFITFLTVLHVLLHKYSGQEDIIIGVDSAGRTHEDLEGLIGLFVNTLPIRIILAPDETFLELLQKARTIVLGAFDHQEYPFNLLAADLKIKRDAARSPLFDVNISWHIAESDYLENEYLEVKPFPTTFIKTHFDLCFNFQEVKAKDKNDRKILALLSYSTDLFDRETIELMRLRFLALLKNISQDPESRIADLDFKIEMEKKYQESIEMDFDF